MIILERSFKKKIYTNRFTCMQFFSFTDSEIISTDTLKLTEDSHIRRRNYSVPFSGTPLLTFSHQTYFMPVDRIIGNVNFSIGNAMI